MKINVCTTFHEFCFIFENEFKPKITKAIKPNQIPTKVKHFDVLKTNQYCLIKTFVGFD